jgi:NitT/TauT family transport system substrate-binding protein
MRRTVRAWVVAAAVCATIMTACGGGTPQTAATSGTPAATGSGSGDIVFPKPEKTNVILGLSNAFQVGALPEMLAKDLHLFEKYGLNVTVQIFNGAAPTAQAHLAGQIDFADQSAGPVLATIGTDTPTVMVMVASQNLTDDLFTQKNIKSAADLKGKSIAISSFGSQSHATMLLALKSLGLTDKDVTLTAVGAEPNRLAAFKAGSVAGYDGKFSFESELVPQGYNALVKGRELKGVGGYPNTSVTVTAEYAQKYPNTVLAMVAAYLDAVTAMKTTPFDTMAQIVAQETGLAMDQASQQLKDELTVAWDPIDGRCQTSSMEFARTVLVATSPNIAKVDVSKACNNAFLDQLKAMGFQHKLGITGY